MSLLAKFLGVFLGLDLGYDALEDALRLAHREVGHVVVLRRDVDQPAVKKQKQFQSEPSPSDKQVVTSTPENITAIASSFLAKGQFRVHAPPQTNRERTLPPHLRLGLTETNSAPSLCLMFSRSRRLRRAYCAYFLCYPSQFLSKWRSRTHQSGLMSVTVRM